MYNHSLTLADTLQVVLATAAVVSMASHFTNGHSWAAEAVRCGLFDQLIKHLRHHAANLHITRALLYALENVVATAGGVNAPIRDALKKDCWEAITKHQQDSQVHESALALLALL